MDETFGHTQFCCVSVEITSSGMAARSYRCHLHAATTNNTSSNISAACDTSIGVYAPAGEPLIQIASPTNSSSKSGSWTN
jgi:hypothetical protein